MAFRWSPSPGIDEDFSAVTYVGRLLRSQLLDERVVAPRPPIAVAAGEIGITWIGHATVLIELDGVRLLTDPIFARRLFVVKRLVAPAIPTGGLGRIDAVLVSHGHRDHLDLPSHHALDTSGATAIVARNLGDLVAPAGYARVVETAWGQTVSLGPVTVTALEVNHWGARNLWRDGRGYTGFLVEGPSGSVFFPGDTAAFPKFREYGDRYEIDVALLPIGAYDPPSFRRVHMNPEDAWKAFRDLRAKTLVPIHWGTFLLSYEPIEEPPRWIQALARADGLEASVALLEHGEGRSFRPRSSGRPPDA